ncbi:GPR endopeptidase [Pasteuria penetrans]|uniref:GPR endopeptidase n=1 Tax=Pasteuria penetrans TaxID=86005 RepID=UPI000F94B061|nr:GPR endopeptidase [Pasteuria penetrans]
MADETMIRTDLAREAYEDMLLQQKQAELLEGDLDGVRVQVDEVDDISMHWLWIDRDRAAKLMGRESGVYFTLEAPSLRNPNPEIERRVTEIFVEQFDKFLSELNVEPNASCLLVGLGNHHVTPDSFGPHVVRHAIVTRHLFQLSPDDVAEGYRPVSALSPGVMGITGVETSEIVQGVVERVQPDLVIVFDALAARALGRVHTTVQVTSTGIHPGSGVGNRRKALNEEVLGVPVMAVGVPTVVDAATIAYDSMTAVLGHLQQQVPGGKDSNREKWMGLLGQLSSVEQRQLIQEVLSPLGHNLWVTPKETDAFIGTMARIVANSLNCTLHAAVHLDNLASHTIC